MQNSSSATVKKKACHALTFSFTLIQKIHVKVVMKILNVKISLTFLLLFLGYY